MKKEKSCGIMVFQNDSVLLVHQNKGHWSLPKGHVEAGETEQETALRETKEETNIDAKIISDFRKIITYSPKPNTIKDVVFFVGIPLSFDLKPQESEAQEVKFIKIKEAIELMNYDIKDLIVAGYNEYESKQ